MTSDLTGGRHSHDMMVEEGRLRVLAGTSLVVEGPQAGQKYLRDMETFDGKRWVRLLLMSIWQCSLISTHIDREVYDIAGFHAPKSPIIIDDLMP